jgi:Dolichyl-phosphate-mannose-protein mannosyltransferase
MRPNPAAVATMGRLTPPILAAAALPLLLVNLYDTGRNRLWYDELQTITHATRPWSAVIPSVLVSDPHGPLYYLLLKPWSLLSESDTFLLLSSSLTAFLAVLVLHRLTARRLGPGVALCAALLLAASPLAVYWSAYLRMYALLMLLAVPFFYANLRLLTEREGPALSLALLVGSGLALAYAHASGVFFVAAMSLAVALHGASADPTLRRPATFLREPGPRLWVLGHVAILVLVVPLVLKALADDAGHADATPSLADAVDGAALLAIGPAFRNRFAAWLAAACVLLVLACGLLDRRPAVAAMSGCVLVTLASALALAFLKPIWIALRLFAHLAPLFAVVTAACLLGLEGRPRPLAWIARGGALAVLALSLWATHTLFRTHKKWDDYPTTVRSIEAEAAPGDIVVANGLREAWGLRWYLAGSAWQRDLEGEIGLGDYLEAVRRGRLGRLRDILEAHDLRGETTSPRVYVHNHLDPRDLDAADRVWLVANNPANIAKMTAALGLGGLPARALDRLDPLAVLVTRAE